jgi:predicted negative regulator of RcsB-dependent stress response
VRAEARHQLKQDQFSKATIQAAGRTVDWTTAHQSTVIAVIVAVVVVAALVLGGWYYINNQNEKAGLDFSTATRTMETPVRPAGVPAQPGFTSFGSTQERATEARKQFQAIMDKYPHTRTADMARYFVGLTSSQLSDHPGAEKNLQEVANSSNRELSALAKFALASVYRAEKKDSQAVDLYKQIIDKPTMTVSKVTAQLELAQLYENQQKPDEAKRIYEQIEKENKGTEVGSLAQQRASQVK